MKKEEKQELLDKDISKIADNEIDDYIKKYVRLGRINKAKLKALTLVPIIALGTIGAGIAGVAADTDNPYTSIRTYNVQYVDADTNKTIEENVKDPDIGYNSVTVEYPYEKINDSYIKKTTTYFTDDDLSDKVNNIINAYPENIENVIDVKDKYDNFEVKDAINSEDNDYQISVVYNDYIGESKIAKTIGDEVLDGIAVFAGTLGGIVIGVYVDTGTVNKQISIENNIGDIDRKVKSLKSRKSSLKKKQK